MLNTHHIIDRGLIDSDDGATEFLQEEGALKYLGCRMNGLRNAKCLLYGRPI